MLSAQQFIKQHVPCQLTAYVNDEGNFAIGYGHTIGVYNGLTITQEKANKVLDMDVSQAINMVHKMYGIDVPLREKIALVSIILDVGFEELKKKDFFTDIKVKPKEMHWYLFRKFAKGNRAISVKKLNRRRQEYLLFAGVSQ